MAVYRCRGIERNHESTRYQRWAYTSGSGRFVGKTTRVGNMTINVSTTSEVLTPGTRSSVSHIREAGASEQYQVSSQGSAIDQQIDSSIEDISVNYVMYSHYAVGQGPDFDRFRAEEARSK